MTGKEIYLPVVGFEKKYLVSNKGRVFNLKSNRYVSFYITPQGYYRLQLSKLFTKKNMFIHRIVMEAFIGKSDLCVNHKNGIKSDNKLENLEYVTHAENNKHRDINGLHKILKHEKHPMVKLTKLDVEVIKIMKKAGFKHKEIADKYGVSRTCISDIGRRTWL